MARRGLTSLEAQQKLLEELETLISKNTTVNWRREIKRNPFSTICSVLIAVAGLLLVIHFAVVSEEQNGTILSQGLFLIFLAAINVSLFGWEVYIARSQKVRHLIVRLRPIFDGPCPWSTSDYPKSSISTLRGNLTVPAYRDGMLVNVPISLLVRGDVIELESGIPCPANSTLLESDSGTGIGSIAIDEVLPEHLFRDEHSKDDTGSDKIIFLPEAKPVRLRVEDSPILAVLKSSLQRTTASTFLTKERNYCKFCVVYIMLLALLYLTSLVVNLIRYFSLPEDFDDSWPELILGIPVYTILPILFLQLPLVWSLTNLYGTTRITLLVENGPQYFQSGGLEHFKVFLRTIRAMAKLVFLFSHYPDYRIFHVLGSLTSVCAVDKEYVLTSGFPSPERVFFFRTEEVSEDEIKHETKKKVNLAQELDPHEEVCLVEDDSLETLAAVTDLTNDPVRVMVTDSDRNGNRNGTTAAAQIDGSGERTEALPGDEPHLKMDATYGLGRGLAPPSLTHIDTVSTLSAFSDSSPFELVTEIFNISQDLSTTSGIAFDQVNWQDHISSLKPIGVNLLATSHLEKSLFHLSPRPDVHSDGLQLYLHKSSCSCALSVEIGVTEYFSRNFAQEVLVHCISDPSLDFQRYSRRRSTATTFVTHNKSIIHPHIISSVMKEASSGETLVMSRGSGDLIAACCSDFWDGKELQPMTTTERESLVDYYNCRSLSSYCIALAYSPLPSVNLSHLPGKEVGIYVPPSHLEHTHGNFNLTSNPLKRGKGRRESKAEEVFRSLQCNQVFLGLMCLQFRPKQDVVALIDDLSIAGIRFVHFTAENELHGKMFAQKLGLEADWNCFISLAPPDEEESSLDNNDGSEDSDNTSISSSILSFFNSTMSNIRARLPKGIKNIRPHITDVDNVPLLVSLFTDCNAETITEMIEIMQENSEVVLCIGNAWNHKNISIFSQADISLSLIPQYLDLPKCSATETCTLSTSNSSSALSHAASSSGMARSGRGGAGKTWPSPLELASYLNSVSCQLCFKRDSDVSLLSLITESRRILFSIRLGMLFGLGSSLTLSLLLLTASILCLPSPLNGGHLLWLLVFTIPLLTLSFLSAPLDPKLCSLMPNSKKRGRLSNMCLVVIEFALLFGMTAFVLLTLFELTLFNICTHDIPNSSCHRLLGDRNRNQSNSAWNGWGRGGEAEQGYLLAQNITAFFTTLYLVVLSIRFVHRTQPIWRLWRFTSWQYVAVATATLLLQVLFCTLSQTLSSLAAISGLHSVPVAAWCVGFIWPVVVLGLEEILKYADKRQFSDMQSFLKLEFGTKLGMHSPV